MFACFGSSEPLEINRVSRSILRVVTLPDKTCFALISDPPQKNESSILWINATSQGQSPLSDASPSNMWYLKPFPTRPHSCAAAAKMLKGKHENTATNKKYFPLISRAIFLLLISFMGSNLSNEYGLSANETHFCRSVG